MSELLADLFLVNYIYYHFSHGDTHFVGQGVRPIYFTPSPPIQVDVGGVDVRLGHRSRGLFHAPRDPLVAEAGVPSQRWASTEACAQERRLPHTPR